MPKSIPHTNQQQTSLQPSKNSGFASQFSIPVRVYYEDTDAGGIVYYVNYLKFMERARTEWLRKLGFSQAALEVMFVVKDAQISYLAPAVLDDQLQVDLAILSFKGAKITFAQQIKRADTLLCQGQVEVVCVKRHNLRPTRLPAPLIDKMLG